MSPTHPPYSVQQLAQGSYDVLLHGIVIASLVKIVAHNGQDDRWDIELLDELSPVRWPAPFTARNHSFISYLAALEWLGICERVETQRSACASKSARKVSSYRAHPSPSERYRLRLLAERSRFYTTAAGLNGLVRRGFIAPTGRTDKEGRVEWAITDAGRLALAEIEP